MAAVITLDIPGSATWWCYVVNATDTDTEALLTNADTTLWLSVLDRWEQNTLFALHEMIYVGPGSWKLEIPASVCPSGQQQWTLRISSYDAAGLTGNWDRDFDIILREDNSL